MIGGSAQDRYSRLAAVVDEWLATDFEALPAAELAQLLSESAVERRRSVAVNAKLIAALSAQATPACERTDSVQGLCRDAVRTGPFLSDPLARFGS